jgi:phage-related protein
MSGMKRLPAIFYALPSGREPVREWLLELAKADRTIVGEDIKDVEFSWPIGMPLCRSVGGGLWEVRSSLPQGRIARVLFCVAHGSMVLLHGFIKKTQKTPAGDLDLAARRMKEVTT